MNNDGEFRNEENETSDDDNVTNHSRVLEQKLQILQNSMVTKTKFLKQLIRDQNDESIIDVSGQKLTDTDMATIVKYAIYEKECTGLNLWGNRFTAAGISILVDALNGNKAIKELDISYNQLSDDGVQMISKVLSLNNCVLEDIDLSSNDIKDRGAKYLADMLMKNRSLKVLVLNKNDITNVGLKLLADALDCDNKTLQQLKLESNQFITEQGVHSLFQLLRHNTNLKELYVRNCSIADGALKDLQTKAIESDSIRVDILI
ncbi:unnamed protein product [Rotaria socialis]|uniref:Uncharacterized protein n=1 Tax=Rotaria socialis TaxID=392032 RepID=A0A818CDP6_9BILA|nr:unnamed protein product [Rotaria socialis]CAF3335984.1 unnamed protein product [Rotaria socialis]CAF3427548.1 unnamed protein product [Rotaria socialis]CAF3656147.1 unnamed protein product [Rotaria socialis]CAF4298999.1 unnamed protein product [Rotaria socialis]